MSAARADFSECRRQLVRRGEEFAEACGSCRAKLSEFAGGFIHDGAVVLVHGFSRAVLSILLRAARCQNFSVVVTEGRAVGGSGYRMVNQLQSGGIPTTLIMDAAVAYVRAWVCVLEWRVC